MTEYDYPTSRDFVLHHLNRLTLFIYFFFLPFTRKHTVPDDVIARLTQVNRSPMQIMSKQVSADLCYLRSRLFDFDLLLVSFLGNMIVES